jgi:hypothetical protein
METLKASDSGVREGKLCEVRAQTLNRYPQKKTIAIACY